MKEEFFSKLKEQIQPYFESEGSHSFWHTHRVYNLALIIAKTEDADLDVVRAAALLHDISRMKEGREECDCHAEDGAKVAEKILSELKFPKEKIAKVVYAISVHRYSQGVSPETKEAEIIQDADRLDALGAITITRIFDYGAKKGRPIYDPNILPAEKYVPESVKTNTSINHFYEKILKIKPESFKTQKARELAKDRYLFVEQFLERFKNEWEGKA